MAEGTTIETAAGNAEMAAAWDGAEGAHWAEHAARYEAAGARFTEVLVGAPDLDVTGHVLDVGCGSGGSSIAIGRRVPNGAVLGVDLSSPMLAVARAAAAAEGLGHVRFEHADAQVHPFPAGTYDVVVSSFGAMFFAEPVAAFANLRGSLRPDGALALLAWRDLARNEWVSEFRGALAAGRDLPTPPPGVPSPFSLADPAVTTECLTVAGFADVQLRSIDEPMTFGRDADDAWPFVSSTGIARGLTADLDEAARADAFGKLRRSLETHETPDGVQYAASAWLITARNGDGA